MRVDQEVGDDAIDCERHVLLVDESANHTLLPVTASELVTEFGNLVSPECNPHQTTRVK